MQRIFEAVLGFMFLFMASSAHAFTGDELAGTALSYDGEGVAYQCKGFVQQIINQELGDYLGTGYCQAYLNLGYEVSGGIVNAQRGDVIQISKTDLCTDAGAESFTTGMHTAIFLEDLGGGVIRVVDSNFVGSYEVGVHDWDIDDWMNTYSNLYLHVYRLGTSSQNEYVFILRRQLAGNDWSTKACTGVTGGAGSNWVYTCTYESYAISWYQTMYVLSGIHNVREDHHFKTDFYRNGVYYTTKYSGWNWVEPYVWEHAYTWASISGMPTGSYEALVFVDTVNDGSDDWEYLDYVPVTVY